jgi:hypothetical protein
VPPPVLLRGEFPPLYQPEYPASVVLGHGSYATSDGSFLYASRGGWRVAYRTLVSEGEFANLARKSDLLTGQLDRFIAPGVRLGAGIGADQTTVWTQRHDWYHGVSNIDWYLREDMNLSASIAGGTGEIRGQEADGSWQGNFILNLQPSAKHNIALAFSPRGDSAFTRDSTFVTAGLMYDILFSRSLTVGAGCRWQKEKLLPQADMNYVIIPRLRLNVLYQPGFERPDWASLYIGERYEQTNPGLAFAENNFFLKEKLSYYWNEESSVDLSFTQTGGKNYIAWEQVAGTPFVSPRNIGERYVSAAALDFAYIWDVWRVTAGASARGNAVVPYVPDYAFSLGLAWAVQSWTIASGYRAVSSMTKTATGGAQLPAYGNLSLELQKTLVQGITLALSADNLLQERIETQSGFYRTGSAFRAALNLQF